MIHRIVPARRRAMAVLGLVLAVGVLAVSAPGCGHSANGGGPEVLPKKFPGRGGDAAAPAGKPTGRGTPPPPTSGQ